MATPPIDFDPYHRWLAIPPKDQPANHYRLLGLTLFEEDVEVIRDAAERQMGHVRLYALGKHSDLSQRVLNELAAARACLLDRAKKEAYDETLRRELASMEAVPQPVAGEDPFAAEIVPLRRLATGRRPQGKWWHDRRVLVALGVAAGVLLVPLLLAGRGEKSPGPKAAPEPAPVVAKPEQAAAKPEQTVAKPEQAAEKPEQPVPHAARQESRDEAPQGPPPLANAPFSAEEAKKHQERWATYLKVPMTLTNSVGMKLVLIPPGEFDMGSSPEEADRYRREHKERGVDEKKIEVNINVMLGCEIPRHRVTITKPFYLGAYEVTQSQWIAVQGKNPSYFRKPTLDEDPGERPVEMPGWNETAEFCKKLSARPEEAAAKHVYWLPTEAEWEYACRAGSDTSYHFGNDETKLGDYAWFEANSDKRPHPVGLKKPNAWGLHDMYGNVWEWCADCWGWAYYKRSPPQDPQGPTPNPFHIRRGGSWRVPGSICRSAFRHSHNGNAYDKGFRVVCKVPPAGTSAPSRPPAP